MINRKEFLLRASALSLFPCSRLLGSIADPSSAAQADQDKQRPGNGSERPQRFVFISNCLGFYPKYFWPKQPGDFPLPQGVSEVPDGGH